MHREGREDSSKYNLNLSLKISSGKFPKKGWNATSDRIYLYLQQFNAARLLKNTYILTGPRRNILTYLPTYLQAPDYSHEKRGQLHLSA